MEFLDQIRKQVRKVTDAEAKWLDKVSKGRITANHVTLASVVLYFPIAGAIIGEYYFTAGVMLIVFGLLDSVDGALARLQKKTSDYGVFLDASTDRIKESLVYMPLVFVAASNLGMATEALIASAALSGALITSYVKAKGESVIKHKGSSSELNRVFQAGFARLEVRMGVMVIGLLFSQPFLAVLAVAVASWLTVFYRIALVSDALR